MWEKTVYVTNDGMEFENEEQALTHELENILPILQNPEHFIACDQEGKVMNINAQELENTLDNAFFMSVKTEKAVDTLNEAFNVFNVEGSAPSEIGHFRWDEGTYEWRELLDDLQELNENWAALGKKFTMV